MPKEENFQQILSQLRTREEANALLRDIDIVLDSYFRVSESRKDEILDSKLSYASSRLFKNLREQFGDDHSAFELFLNRLKEKIRSLPLFSITISFDPLESTVEMIKKWVSDNIHGNVILEITVNPNILGGAQITYGGRYKDLSLKNRFDRVFETDKEEIMKFAVNSS